jgi:hypothetical protein
MKVKLKFVIKTEPNVFILQREEETVSIIYFGVVVT